MDDKEVFSVPYVVYEGEMARNERTIKKLFIALIVTIICLVGTNVCWMIYESQFETVTYGQDGDGINNVNYGSQGDLDNVPEGED